MKENEFANLVEDIKALFGRYDLQVSGRLTIRDNVSELPINFDSWYYLKSKKDDFMLFLPHDGAIITQVDDNTFGEE